MFRRNYKITAYGVGLTLISLFIMISTIAPKTATAASSISITDINYFNSTITLKLNDADKQVYFSDSKKTTWEEVPGKITSDNHITMDISWISPSKNYILTFKGDASKDVVSVTIPKQVTKFKATYSKTKGTVAFTNAGSRTIQWRKKSSTIWNTVVMSELTTELGYLCNNGAAICFRLSPINGTSADNAGLRPSKEVTVTIPKKASAPTIVINGSTFSIAVKKGMGYRTLYADGSTSEWSKVSTATDLLLKNVAPSSLYTDASTTQSEVTLQFRTNSSSAAQVSKITTITVPKQEGTPNVDTYGISLNYTSSSTLSLQVKAASSTVPFEYTVIKEDNELDYLTAKWTKIASSTAISLNNVSAPKGSRIFLRKASVDETTTVDFSLASVELDVSGVGGITYPDAPEASTLSTLISTAGLCKATDSSTYLSFSLYSATSTTVSAISFLDTYNITRGSVTCKSTVVKNPNSMGPDDKYIITTKITSTDTIDSLTEELLYAKITLANTDVITSSDTAGVRLYLYPKTKVNNPTTDQENEDYKDFTDNFSRVYLSNDTNDDSKFKFQLDFGTKYIADPSTVGTFTSTAVAISSMKYDGYTLTNGTDYTITYGSYINDDEETIATAIVTVNTSIFEKSSLIDTTDKELPLVIKLNNGEILNEDVFITLVKTATLKDTPVAWSITEGSLKETKTSTVTNADNTTTTVTTERVDYTLTLTLFDSNYGVSISDVTWDGISIFGSAKISGGTATIDLSNAKINKLSTTSTTTKNIVITLSNGYQITTGCKLTILDKS